MREGRRNCFRRRKIADIQVYPIKSLGGFSVKEWPVLPEGLAFDRQWMLVDENGKFITQRTNANLALLKVHSFHWEDDFFEVESLLTQRKIQIPPLFSALRTTILCVATSYCTAETITNYNTH